MEPLVLPKPEKAKILKWVILGIVIIAIFGYLGVKLAWISPEIFERLPAQIFKPAEEKTQKILEELIPEIQPEIQKVEEKKYLEKAEWGEGITHLARKAVKKYLQENPQNFEVTPEHKIYLEDYLAKKMGEGWLNLGQTLEFSQDLIKEAIDKAETLTPEQLENLTQYSQLVPSLIY